VALEDEQTFMDVSPIARAAMKGAGRLSQLGKEGAERC
jgi:hypothetical protein